MLRLDGLLKEGGELARVLQQHTGPGSKLQTTMMAAIAPLLAPLKKTIEDLLAGFQRQQMDALETQRARQAAFEKDILEKVTRLETRKDALRRGVKAGQDFEVQVCEFTSSILSGGPYDVEFTANTAPPGSRRKVGDVVVAFNSESRFSGSRIVLEAKYEANMTPKKALAELAEARENRSAQVGVFVLSSVAAASSTAFPAFMRCGCDILVHWSPEEPASDAYLHAALLLALALAARLQTHEVVDELRALGALEKVLTGHLQRAEGLQKKAKVLVTTANDMAVELNAGIGEVREMADAVNRLLRSARAEHAVEVETSSEQVVAVNQLGAEGLALPPG